nr:hypothetical protein [Nitrososphaeria archaeon]
EFNLPLIGLSSKLEGFISPKGFFTFGIAYAFTGSGCTLPIFLAVILYASLTPGLGALITMLTYSLGVAIPLIATGVLAAKTNQVVIKRLAYMAPRIHRAAGFILMGAGIYLIYYYYVYFLAATL